MIDDLARPVTKLDNQTHAHNLAGVRRLERTLAYRSLLEGRPSAGGVIWGATGAVLRLLWPAGSLSQPRVRARVAWLRGPATG